MKAKVTGRSAWQGTPISGSLDVQVAARYVDSEGNASVSRYTGVLNAGKTGWANSLNTAEDLWLVVQGPDDPKGVRATFRETLVYADRTVTTEFSRVLRSSDLTGLIFDYAEPIFEAEDLDFGDAPLTMRAAQQVIEEGGAVVSEWSDIKVDIAQTTEEMRTVAGTYNVGRMPTAGDPAGVYRVVLPDGSVVDAPWDGEALGTPSPALATLSEIADALTGAESRLDGVIQGAEAQVQGVVTLAGAKIQETNQALQALQGVANVIKGLRVENPVSHLTGQAYDFVLDTQAVTTATVFPADNGGLLYDLIGGPQ
ncbi:hypothetical protein [Deinococcus sp. 6GRE01]|uniref:hypothetical protein n=1 Tax=Deinococcus sp. 6GRE01 TaxID=2745873 RepID=UPI001E5F2167|nr:hypothetical protein [Deinococcus sp. 6GRE01]MCD0155896.1 hypothetical protein [Deinococcus sp. 6GRE01]